MNFGRQMISVTVMPSAHQPPANSLEDGGDVLGTDCGFVHRAPVSVLPSLGLGR